MLTDQHGRRINYLRVSITDRCNLRCRYCMPPEGVPLKQHADLLTFEEIATIVRAGAELGITKLRLTGGEPLVRKGALDLVRMLAAVPGIRDFAMTSNGLLLADQAARLREAGLQRINISLDTLQPERFKFMTGSDAWQRVMDGIAAALAAGFEQVKLNVVAIRGYNDDEIADFMRFVHDKPLQLRFIEFMPVGNAFWAPEKMIPAAEIKARVQAVANLVRFVTSDRSPAAEVYGIEGSPATVGFIAAMSQKFCARCCRLRLTADGFLKPCLACTNEINIKVPVRMGHKGSELKRVFYEALRLKPRQHGMEAGAAQTKRHMAEVGG